MCNKNINFSLWADFIEREFIKTELKQLIKDGIVNGATSNPAIFKNAILTSSSYKEQVSMLDGFTPKAKYEELAIFDIRAAADALKDNYDQGDDGYVSIEVDPFLCDDAMATIEEGARLFKKIDRANVMIKVPATQAGYLAMKELSAMGINVNATLIFSLTQAQKCLEAFKDGLSQTNKKTDTVISIFVSRIDRALDEKLKENNIPTALAGIYNAANIYNIIKDENNPNIRTLFASTGVKGDELETSYYIKELLANDSINTAPIDTIKAYVIDKTEDVKLPLNQNSVDQHFDQIKKLNIDFDQLLDKQVKDGLKQFKDAFQEILDSLKD